MSSTRKAFLWIVTFLVSLGAFTQAGAPVLLAAAGERGVVATVHPMATEAGINAFKRGGNAIDAAVAAAVTLGVVDGFNSGIGGGCFILIHRSNGEIIAIDGREMAPAAAHRDMYLRDGKADSSLSQTGPLASGVPGAIAAYEYAVKNYGRLALKEALLPAAKIAADGFTVEAGYARRIEGVAKTMADFPASKAIFLKPDGKPLGPGDKLVQKDLATTYRGIAEQGSKWFYAGPFAKAAGEWMRENGGIMTEADFRNYKVALREPLRTTYRGHEIIGFPPPSSGGVHVAQILNIVETFDLKKMGPGSADFIHVVTESMKLAFADRAWWLGDPDFAKVPRGLAAKEYAVQLAKGIRMDRASTVPKHGTPPNSQSDIFGKHTTHFCAADAEGNWVACTATVNTTFGSKVVIPGTGVVMNNEMDDFAAQPGVANYFGLLGNEANAVAPGKRPLSSMSPTIVLRDGKPIFSAGAAGGPTIISQTLLAVINRIDFGMDPKPALAQPRFHHQWSPDELKIESGVGKSVREELERRGHKLNTLREFGACQAMGRNPDGVFIGSHDPRLNGKAETW